MSSSTPLLLALLLLACTAHSKLVEIDEVTSVFNNSVYGENDLWTRLYSECGTVTTYQCVQDSVYTYMDKSLDSDMYVMDGLSFVQNSNNYSQICTRVKKDDPGEYSERVGKQLRTEDDFAGFVEEVERVEKFEESKRRGKSLDDSGKRDTLEENSVPKKVKNIQDVTDILYDRGVRYLMTHDVEVGMPSFVFGGGRVKISPRGFDEDGGVIVKLNALPEPQQEGRLFFKQIQKIFKKKLMTSMMAAVLIIKLLKLKAMFFLPLLLGVGTAKKILLKVLLFVFPALAHLFKLCSYYHKYHHGHTKFHHHHHQIAHHHHHVPVPIYASSHSEVGPGELPAPYPAATYEATGPGVYGHSRTESPGSINDLAAWGLGEYPSSWDSPATLQPAYSYPSRQQPQQVAPTAQVQYASQADLKRLYAAPVKQQYAAAQQNQQSYAAVAAQAAALQQRFQSLTPRPTAAAAVAADPFYGGMLARLDAVFTQLGVHEEGCKERVVCSMYKNPVRYSPHSNLVSAELSRDPTELQKPSSVNTAVVRYYRYVQAARDGQDLKDCLRIYAACSINTEK